MGILPMSYAMQYALNYASTLRKGERASRPFASQGEASFSQTPAARGSVLDTRSPFQDRHWAASRSENSVRNLHSDPLENQHTVAIAKEPITLAHGLLIRGQHPIPARHRRDQHEQRGFW